jgi:hypothetical protein
MMTVIIIRSTVEDRTRDKLRTELNESEMSHTNIRAGSLTRLSPSPSPPAAHI